MTGTAELPVGVVIRTPPGSPSRQLAIIGPPETFHLGSEQVSPASHVNLLGIFQAGSMRWDVKPADLGPAEVEISRFRHLRKNIPLNRFISEFLELGKLYQKIHRLRTKSKADKSHLNSKIISSSHHVVSRTDVDP